MTQPSHHDHHRPSRPAEGAPVYWSTLEQYFDTPAYRERAGEEFFPDAKPERYFEAEDGNAGNGSGMSRRGFLKLSGFAAVMAALQGCERPVQKIIPYVNAPEEITPGVQMYYATTCMECPAACGAISTNRDGRPIKVEGNAAHPMSRGGMCARGQATFQNLYNPDRVTQPYEFSDTASNWLPVEWDAAISRAASQLAALGGKKVVLLSPTLHGPSHRRLLADLKRAFPTFEHVQFDPLQSGADARAAESLFGVRALPRYKFDKARTVVLFGGDPIGQGASRVEYQHDLAMRRKPGPEMSRLYAFEPVPTMTGTYSDYRFRVAPQHLLTVAAAVARAAAPGSPVASAVPALSLEDAEREAGIPAGTLAKMVERLKADAGDSIVYCNAANNAGPEGETLAALCLALNHALGNVGKTIDLAATPSNQALGSHRALAGLVGEINSGAVGALFLLDVNPVYQLPETSGIAEAIPMVPLTVSLSRYRDESVFYTKLQLPGRHWLESWGDAEPQAGLYSILQPMIDMPWQCRQWEDTLMQLATAAGSDVFKREIPHAITATDEEKAKPPAVRAATYHEYVKESWADLHKRYDVEASFDSFWESVLRNGFFDQAYKRRDDFASAQPAFKADGLRAMSPAAFEAKPSDLNLVLYASNVHGDGDSMLMPFLLELPDAHTKVAWDNYIGLSKSKADALALETGDWAEVSANGGSVQGPVWIWPGLDDRTVAVMLGWGRRIAAGVGPGYGIDATPLVKAESNGWSYRGAAAKVEKREEDTSARNPEKGVRLGAVNLSISNRIAGKYPFANVQGHNYLEGRPIFFETTLHQLDTPDFEHHIYNHHSSNAFQNMWGKEHKYAGHHWGMTIDYNACSSCGACVVACQAENNIPVVGKGDVIKGREMHWIRIDRYYRGDVDNPDHAFQAMLCQHCGTAPCETVCPVIATLHNDEGLNTMIYNRCVGTRYCSNNCPYKVRRFNFLLYQDWDTPSLKLQRNPDVTVRSRGVMEKCTYCVQRINHARVSAKLEDRQIRDGEVLTACQSTCPTDAIVFGNLNDPESRVSKLKAGNRNYSLLAELNTRPRTTYLAIVRNPNTTLEPAGTARTEGEG
ncbi:MAG: TAT-variant-translocated molybdopterin oxidoreductase [Candidatus Sumerlaeia bacterium]|nr:TAT-variant-translocated molybdopterin oxidoreductase [Candidatus Sumerlaeia bacterium]